jgi:hypothetical protein
MRTEVAKRLYVGESDVLYSQAVSMQGGNAVFVEVTVFNQGSADNVTVTPQLGNDLENWEDNGGVSPLVAQVTGVDYDTVQVTGIAAQYVRLKYTRTTADAVAVVAAGLNVANL